MKIHATLPALFCLVLSSRVACPEDLPDAGVKGESMPFLGPIPEEKSKSPTLAEWTAATDIGGNFSEAYPCKLRRVREWLRFRCLGDNGLGAELLAGTATEVSLFNAVEEGTCTDAEPGNPQSVRTCKTRVEVVFPLRRGDRRFFQVIQQGSNRWSLNFGFQPTVMIGAVLSAVWVEDEPSPVVVAKQYDP